MLSFVCCLLYDACRLLLHDVCCLLLVIRCLLFIVGRFCLLLVVSRCLLRVYSRCLLRVVYCLVCGVCCVGVSRSVIGVLCLVFGVDVWCIVSVDCCFFCVLWYACGLLCVMCCCSLLFVGFSEVFVVWCVLFVACSLLFFWLLLFCLLCAASCLMVDVRRFCCFLCVIEMR